MTSFFENFDVISHDHHGFVKNRSIDQAIFKAFIEIFNALNDKEYTAVTFLDLSKAFDTLDIDLLLYKLPFWGIRGTALNLIKSYLTNRQQCVKLRYTENNKEVNLFSNFQSTSRGVPQGSVLGPLLFVIYTNDLPLSINNKMILFADDTTVLFHEHSENSLILNINNTFSLLNNWYEQNALKLNIDKTQLLCLRNNIREVTVDYTSQVLNVSDHAKFLGLYIDKNLNYNSHIDFLVKKLSKLSYMLYKLRDIVPSEIVTQTYYAHIHSNIRYGILFWGNSASVDKVLKIQKRCVRTIVNANQKDHAKPIFKKLKILTVIDTYILECALFVRKNFNLFDNHLYNHTHNTRKKQNMIVMQTKKAYIDSGVLNTCIRIYNKIPVAVKNLSIMLFKKTIKKSLLQQNHYTLEEFMMREFAVSYA